MTADVSQRQMAVGIALALCDDKGIDAGYTIADFVDEVCIACDTADHGVSPSDIRLIAQGIAGALPRSARGHSLDAAAAFGRLITDVAVAAKHELGWPGDGV